MDEDQLSSSSWGSSSAHSSNVSYSYEYSEDSGSPRCEVSPTGAGKGLIGEAGGNEVEAKTAGMDKEKDEGREEEEGGEEEVSEGSSAGGSGGADKPGSNVTTSNNQESSSNSLIESSENELYPPSEGTRRIEPHKSRSLNAQQEQQDQQDSFTVSDIGRSISSVSEPQPWQANGLASSIANSIYEPDRTSKTPRENEQNLVGFWAGGRPNETESLEKETEGPIDSLPNTGAGAGEDKGKDAVGEQNIYDMFPDVIEPQPSDVHPAVGIYDIQDDDNHQLPTNDNAPEPDTQQQNAMETYTNLVGDDVGGLVVEQQIQKEESESSKEGDTSEESNSFEEGVDQVRRSSNFIGKTADTDCAGPESEADAFIVTDKSDIPAAQESVEDNSSVSDVDVNVIHSRQVFEEKEAPSKVMESPSDKAQSDISPQLKLSVKTNIASGPCKTSVRWSGGNTVDSDLGEDPHSPNTPMVHVPALRLSSSTAKPKETKKKVTFESASSDDVESSTIVTTSRRSIAKTPRMTINGEGPSQHMQQQQQRKRESSLNVTREVQGEGNNNVMVERDTQRVYPIGGDAELDERITAAEVQRLRSRLAELRRKTSSANSPRKESQREQVALLTSENKRLADLLQRKKNELDGLEGTLASKNDVIKGLEGDEYALCSRNIDTTQSTADKVFKNVKRYETATQKVEGFFTTFQSEWSRARAISNSAEQIARNISTQPHSTQSSLFASPQRQTGGYNRGPRRIGEGGRGSSNIGDFTPEMFDGMGGDRREGPVVDAKAVSDIILGVFGIENRLKELLNVSEAKRQKAEDKNMGLRDEIGGAGSRYKEIMGRKKSLETNEGEMMARLKSVMKSTEEKRSQLKYLTSVLDGLMAQLPGGK